MNKTQLEVDQMVKLLKLMGDKTRYTIVSMINQRKHCVCQLQEVLNASQPSISQHLRKLKDAGLVTEEKKGQWVYYSLNEQSELFEAIQEILRFTPISEEQIHKLDELNITFGC